MTMEWRRGASRVVAAISVIACSGLVAACAPAIIATPVTSVTTGSGRISASCRKAIVAVRRAVAEADVIDAEARHVPGFPIFRVNRLLQVLGERFGAKAGGESFNAWADRLYRLDEVATRYEISNLPDDGYRELGRQIFGRPVSREQIFAKWRTCSRLLSHSLVASSRARRDLVGTAKVPENYSELARTTGLFPLISVPVAAGWEQWKRDNLRTFYRPASDLPVAGRLVEFFPPRTTQVLRASEVRDIVERSRDPRLGIPEPMGEDLRRLLEAFAPLWVVDVAGFYDRLGHPAWNSAGEPVVDIGRPTVFTRVSHTVFGKRILLQLNYSIWFQERPRDSAMDLLGGRLDGIIWRVTLGADGKPLVYDSIHTCGCYHLLFPLRSAHAEHQAGDGGSLRERPAILRVAPDLKPGQRIELRVASATHYLQTVRASTVHSNQRSRHYYQTASDGELRSLPGPRGGRRSLFRSDGIVAGTERLERFVLWPTGVRSPGAMRQWGHHAIAFADKRHFDDPHLFDSVLWNAK